MSTYMIYAAVSSTVRALGSEHALKLQGLPHPEKQLDAPPNASSFPT